MDKAVVLAVAAGRPVKGLGGRVFSAAEKKDALYALGHITGGPEFLPFQEEGARQLAEGRPPGKVLAMLVEHERKREAMQADHGVRISREYKTVQEDALVIREERRKQETTLAGSKLPNGKYRVTKWKEGDGPSSSEKENWHHLAQPQEIDPMDGGMIRRLLESLNRGPMVSAVTESSILDVQTPPLWPAGGRFGGGKTLT